MRLMRTLSTVTLFSLVCASGALVAWGEPLLLPATIDTRAGFESTFTFDFGGGFLETAYISNTEFVLQVDAEAAPGGAAEFKSYYQEVDSINLPDPMGGADPIPTGALTIEILPGTSGVGSYDPATGQFTTSEVYRIHFAGDLSAYGLTDGFVDLPSASAGTITLDEATGSIQQVWQGEYTFPGSNVALTYQCEVNARVVPEPDALALLVCGLYGLWRRRTR